MTLDLQLCILPVARIETLFEFVMNSLWQTLSAEGIVLLNLCGI